VKSILSLLLAFAGIAICSIACDDQPSGSKTFVSEDPKELGASFMRYFKEAGGGPKGYLKGKFSGDRAIMLQAAFEELHSTLFCHHLLCAIHDGRGVIEVSKVARDQANRLIGFFSCALKQDPPAEWKNGLLTAIFREDLYLGHDQKIKWDGTFSGTTVMYRQTAKTPTVKVVEEVCKLFDNNPEIALSFTVENGNIYVVDYDRNGGMGQLQCYDQATKKFTWNARVLGLGMGIIAGLGANQHFVFVRLTPDEVIVYGVHSFGLYVEVFNRSNGKCLVRCASNLWNNRRWLKAKDDMLPSPSRGEGPGVRGLFLCSTRFFNMVQYELQPLTPNPSPREGEGNQTNPLTFCHRMPTFEMITLGHFHASRSSP
jgi:histone H3/H4